MRRTVYSVPDVENTHSLFFLPRFHGALVLLKLVTPVRVHPMVVQRPGGRRTPVRVHRQVERAQQVAGQLTFVPAAVFFGRSDDHHAALDGRDVFLDSAVKHTQGIDHNRYESINRHLSYPDNRLNRLAL